MKRVRCPKCDNYVTFDETKYQVGQSLVFECPECGKNFGIRIGLSKLRNTQKEALPKDIVVIENVFHYKQVITLKMGNNVIVRYMKGSNINCTIETNDPSIDMTHCIINVSRKRDGKIQYVICDGPSYTGTFVDNEILKNKERRVIKDGCLFTIGATSIILRATEE